MEKLKERVLDFLKRIEKDNIKGKKINSVLELRPKEEILSDAEKIQKKIDSKKAGRLAGKVILVKANINVKGLSASCASKTLQNYKSSYDATVIEKIRNEDGLIIGTTNMDEFACGSSGETSYFGPIKNPAALEFIPGGSSSGSAASVAAEFCDISLGSDTGGSIRNPASHCGVVGLKPTYSNVSRYGLIDLSMSLDQIGPLSKTVEESELLFESIKGKDVKDSISQDFKSPRLPKKFRVGILSVPGVDKKISSLIEETHKKLEKKGLCEIKEVDLKYIDLAIETYYLLVYTEFFSGTRRIDGRKYGLNIDESCGEEVFRRIQGGKEVTRLEHEGRAYYQALKIKKLIEKEFERVFKEVDIIISPAVPRLPHKIGEKISFKEMYSYDSLTIPANLGGICALVLPAGKIEKIPVGIQLMANKGHEDFLFKLGKEIEKLINAF